jgi:hypothetical protein
MSNKSNSAKFLYKRRVLEPGQDVVFIYLVDVGFVQLSGSFKEYRSICIGDIKHDIPVFELNNKEITGLECFWILPSDIDDDSRIESLQRELIDLQLSASETAFFNKYNVPTKIKDKEIQIMAKKNAEFRTQLIQKLGYDPLDYSWVEKELAESPLEQLWFRFLREHKGSVDDNWEKSVKEFRDQYFKDLTISEAFDLSRKWKRFLIGAWNTIASQNPNIEDWKSTAKKFEAHHRAIENRMMLWTMQNKHDFPIVSVVEPIRFRHGPYFNNCIERVPHLFTDATCYMIRAGVMLQVVAFDPELKYIRLDFTPDIRDLIKPGVSENDPNRPLRIDYVIYVSPDEVETKINFLKKEGKVLTHVV